jgi:hypothetical protein
MSEYITIVRHRNWTGDDIAVEYCKTNHEVRKAVGHILDCWENGDSITFEEVSE